MNKEMIKTALDNLEGISYYDWQKIKMAVDDSFSKKEKEYERELKLDSGDAMQAIQRQFG